jgi:hypothetical protein
VVKPAAAAVCEGSYETLLAASFFVYYRGLSGHETSVTGCASFAMVDTAVVPACGLTTSDFLENKIHGLRCYSQLSWN